MRLFLGTCKFRRLYFVACYLFCRLQLLSLQGLTFVNHRLSTMCRLYSGRARLLGCFGTYSHPRASSSCPN
ncbi:hypothetical protein FB446DRAFT_713444 [Lentinula raphanica]|nr:hypothetical protein FB446DRAFT_713444 [Lentinula raphanica]